MSTEDIEECVKVDPFVQCKQIAQVVASDFCQQFGHEDLSPMKGEHGDYHTFFFGDMQRDWFSLCVQRVHLDEVDLKLSEPVSSHECFEVYFLDGWFNKVMIDDLCIMVFVDADAKIRTRKYEDYIEASNELRLCGCMGSDEL